MKRVIYFCFLFLFAVVAVSAQKAMVVKTKSKARPVKTFKREKFDPMHNAAEDLQAAITKAEKENKRIVLDVGGEWCGWCIHMDNFFEMNPKLKNLRDKNYVWLKVNMSEENENKEFLSKYPEAKGYPHLYVLEKDGTLLLSKDTVELESGKTYNLKVFTNFLTEWSPMKKATK